MSAFKRTHRLVAVAVILVAALGLGLALVLRGEDTPAADEITLPTGSGPSAVAAAAGRLPAQGGTLRMGPARLEVNRPEGRMADLDRALVAMAGVRAPVAGIELQQGTGPLPLTATVDRREQAPAVARELLAKLAPDGAWPEGVSSLIVRVAGVDSVVAGSPVIIDRDVAGDPRALAPVLDAAVALAGRSPGVTVSRQRIALRVQADDVADAAPAWREAAAAVELDRARRERVQLYVDVPQDDGTLPVLGGPVGRSPERAVALLRELGGDSARRYVDTGGSFASVRVERPRQAREKVRAAQSAGIRRLLISWPVDGETAWFDSAGVDRESTTIDDRPATVKRLLPAVERAQAAGFPALAWDRPGNDGTARLRLARPRWLDPDVALARDPGELRRLVRAIRSIRWPGTATVAVGLGPGTCESSPNAVALARVSSTSAGRARSLIVGGCGDDEQRDALRRAWEDTAR